MSLVQETTLFFDSTKGVGSSQNFKIIYNPPLQLDQKKKYVIGLVSSEIWYSWYNVNATNNVFKYNNGTIWKTIILSPGAYNVVDINSEIKRLISSNDDDSTSIEITPNYNTLKSRVVITNSYQIDFTVANSIRTVLGFISKILSTNGIFDSANNVNITDINSLLIRCSVVPDS